MGMAGRRRRGRGESGEEGRRGGTIHEMDGAGLQDPAEGMADGAAWRRAGTWRLGCGAAGWRGRQRRRPHVAGCGGGDAGHGASAQGRARLRTATGWRRPRGRAREMAARGRRWGSGAGFGRCVCVAALRGSEGRKGGEGIERWALPVDAVCGGGQGPRGREMDRGDRAELRLGLEGHRLGCGWA